MRRSKRNVRDGKMRGVAANHLLLTLAFSVLYKTARRFHWASLQSSVSTLEGPAKGLLGFGHFVRLM